MNGKTIKIIGFVATLLGVGVSLATKWVDEKNLDLKINEQIAKAISEQK